MSFIQTELDHAAFIRSAAWPDPQARQIPPLDIAFSCNEQAAPAVVASGLIDEIAAFGVPGLAIPLLFTLTLGTPPGWLLAALSLPLAAAVARAVAAGSRGARWLSVLGHAALALGLIALAGDHAATLIAYAGTLPATYLALPLTAVLITLAWFVARQGLMPTTRDLLVVESLTLALTLIVLANHATLGSGAFASYRGTTPISWLATDVGLTTLSPILSLGIAFSFFVAGLRSFRGLARAYAAIATNRSLSVRK